MSDNFDPMAESEFDALEKGDEVRHKDDPKDKTREVTREPEENALAGHVVQVEVQHGTIGRDNIKNWGVVDE